MKQVLIIHGGESFSSYDQYMKSLRASLVEYESLKLRKKWKPWIAEQMPGVDVLLPTFPNGYNAVYDEWVVYFEKLIPFFGDDVRLVGHSLGAMFLAKYLNEKPLARKVRQLVLIAGGYDDDSYEDLGSFGVSSAANVPKSADEVHLFHSKDDFVVPYAELAKFEKDMPTATVHSFDDRAHFNGETFPELLELLKQK